MKAVTSAQMRELDRRTIDDLGVPGLILMENAGDACFRVAVELLGGEPARARVGVFCGKGNNGGDGFVAARRLINAGADVEVFLCAERAELGGDALTNLIAAEASGVDVVELPGADWDEIEEFMFDCDLAVDALLGTGARGELGYPLNRAVEIMNRAACPTLAVDVPTGVDSDTGRAAGQAVEAAATVTFALPKLGLLTPPGADHCGRVFAASISIPQWLLDEAEAEGELVTPELALEWLPARRSDAHKGDCGRVLLIGGSAGMVGAPVYMARAASLAGAGLVYLAVPDLLADPVAARLQGEIIRRLPSTRAGTAAAAALDSVRDLVEACDAVAVGPGLTTDPETAEFFFDLLRACDKPLVVDADGLNLAARDLELLARRDAPTVITPHPGEAARLLGGDSAPVQARRFAAVRELARSAQAVAVLKGAATLTAGRDDDPVLINPTGNPGMAAGGTGDLLTGLVAGFLAQGVEPFAAAGLGAFIHGLAGDLAAEQLGGLSMGPGDLLDFIPHALLALIHGSAPNPVELI